MEKAQDFTILSSNLNNFSVADAKHKGAVVQFKFKKDNLTLAIETSSYKFLWVTIKIDIDGLNTANETIAKASSELACFFEMEDLVEKLQLEDHKIKNKDLVLLLGDVAYSVGRGMLIQAFKGTIFEFAILPFVELKFLGPPFEIVKPRPVELVE